MIASKVKGLVNFFVNPLKTNSDHFLICFSKRYQCFLYYYDYGIDMYINGLIDPSPLVF